MQSRYLAYYVLDIWMYPFIRIFVLENQAAAT